MSNETQHTPADVRELAVEIIRSLDLIARNYDGFGYGLPVMTHYDEMVDTVVALLRTPRGEGEAMDADAMWYHWSSGHEDAALQGLRTATDDEAHRFLSMLADWQRCPMPSDHDAAVALRPEAGGEEGGGVPAHVYVVTANDDERVAEQKVFANYNDARREYLRLVDLYGGSAVCLASRYVRRALTALRSEARGEDELAALVVHMWLSKEQRGPMYTESGDFYVDFRRAYELAAARTNGGIER